MTLGERVQTEGGSRRSCAAWMLVAALAFLAAAPARPAPPASPATHQYLYVLRLVPRLQDPKAWTEHDHAAVTAHFKRLQEATAKGTVILAGRTDEPMDQTFGLVVFEAPDEAHARAFMNTDPTIVEHVMVGTLHPYSVALLRSAPP
jgi:uncharacterized protein YciI